MTKKLVWRLGKLPSVEELRELVKDKIITQDEAREILFNQETAEDRDKESLKEEIKFLREMIDKLSERRTDRIVEVFKYIQPNYPRTVWWNTYDNNINLCSTSGTENFSLSSIKTF